MLQAFVDSSRGGRRTVFQYITMLSVVVPVHHHVVGGGTAGGRRHRPSQLYSSQHRRNTRLSD